MVMNRHHSERQRRQRDFGQGIMHFGWILALLIAFWRSGMAAPGAGAITSVMTSTASVGALSTPDPSEVSISKTPFESNGSGSVTATPQFKFVFNTDAVFDTLNEKVLPDILPGLVPDIFAGVDTTQTGNLIEADLGSATLDEVDNERIDLSVLSKARASIAAKIIEWLADSIGIKLTKNMKKEIKQAIEDHIKSNGPAIYYSYKIRAKDMHLKLKSSNVGMKVNPTDTNTLTAELGIKDLEATGVLAAKVTLTIFLDWSKIGLGWLAELIGDSDTSEINITMVNQDWDFTAKDFAGVADVLLEFDAETKLPKVKKTGDLKLTIGSFDFEWFDVEEGLNEMISSIVNLRLGAHLFLTSECADLEDRILEGVEEDDLSECVGRVLTKAMKETLPALTDGMNTAVTESLAKVFAMEQDVDTKRIDINATVGLSSFAISPDSPVIDTVWNGNLVIDYQKHTCAGGLSDATFASGDVSTYTGGGGEADLALPMTFAETLITTALISGELCHSISYPDATLGTLDGQLVPNGPITLSGATYDGVWIIWDNSEDLKAENAIYAAACLGTDVNVSAGSGTSRAIGTNKAVQSRTSTLTNKGTSKGTGAVVKVITQTPYVQYDPDGDLTYDVMMVTNYSGSGVQADVPVLFKANTTYLGQDVDISTQGTLHVVGVFEPDEKNEIKFNIKQAWTDGFAATTEVITPAGTVATTISGGSIETEINEYLSETYYATRVEFVTYSICAPDTDSQIINPSCRVQKEWTYETCGDDCELDSGLKVTSLEFYDYELRTDEILTDSDTVTLGLTTTREDTSSDSGCPSGSGDVDLDRNVRIEEMIAMGKVAGIIRQQMIREGAKNVTEMEAKLQGDLQQMERLIDEMIIDEDQPTTEEFKLYVVNLAKQVKVITNTDFIQSRIITTDQLIQKATVQKTMMQQNQNMKQYQNLKPNLVQ